MAATASRPDGRRAALRELGHPWVVAPVVVVAVAAVVARFVAAGPLWAQEALAVDLARLPVGDLGDALRHGGAPPLFPILLHGWTSVFGTGDHAVRALAGVVSLAGLPLMYLAGRRLAGPRAGLLAVLVLALSPYYLRYGSEAAMYSLVVVLVLTGFLAVTAALERPTGPRLLGVVITCGALLWTHPWSAFAVAATGAILVGRWVTSATHRRATAQVLVAVAVGCATFAPWVPTFLDQIRELGAPWGPAFRPATLLVTSVMEFTGGPQPLMFLAVVLIVVGLFGAPLDGRHVELDFRLRADVRMPALVLLVMLVLAAGVGAVTGSGFEPGYAAVFLPFFVLLVALGLERFSGTAARSAALATFAVLSVIGLIDVHDIVRTQADEVAAAIERDADGPSVVVVCPAQIGPSVARELDPRVEALAWPDLGSPRLVDWDDYAGRARRSDAAALAAEIATRAGSRTLYVVTGDRHPLVGGRCDALVAALRTARRAELLVGADIDDVKESMDLYVFAP